MQIINTLPAWGWILILIIMAVVVWAVGIWWYAAKIESPNYTLISQKDGLEVRQYEPILVAQVQVNGTVDQAMNDGFRQLAGFIFGGNTTSESVAMTTPVMEQSHQNIAMTAPVLDQANEPGRLITFTIPSKWTKETLPKPNNPNVKITEWPSENKVAYRFRAISNNKPATRAKVTKQFLAKLEAQGFEHQGDLTFAFYNPPWTPFFLRRNEVLVTLD